MVVHLFYARLPATYDALQMEEHLKKMPVAIRDRIRRFRRWQDAQCALVGKLLLIEGLERLRVTGLFLHDLEYTPYQRPYFKNYNIDFNISHAEEYVICAISRDSKVGVDIEKIKPVDISDFTGQWTPKEWDLLMKADDRLLQFYNFWTRKEAIIKADGRGLGIPLQQIDVSDSSAIVEGTTWYLQGIPVDNGYIAHVAAAAPAFTVTLHKMDVLQ